MSTAALHPPPTRAAPSARAKALLPVLSEHSVAIETLRALPAPVLRGLQEAGLFRLTLPGFLEAAGPQPLPVLAEVTQTIARGDASAAWCLGQALGCAMSAAFLEPDAARQVFGSADAVLAWGAGTAGQAVPVAGGYRVTGTWRFASGGKHATWLGAHCRLVDADGGPLLDGAGKPMNRTALFPRDQAEILDDWHVMGLKGTRSEGYSLHDLFVPEAFTIDRETLSSCRVDAPLYKFPTTNVYAAVFSGVALGIARAGLDDLVDLARHKTARAARTALRDSPVFQTQLATLEAQWGAAHAFQRQTLTEVWETVAETGVLELEDRARLRLCTTHAINEAVAVMQDVYRLAGSTAIFEGEPFERRFRDIHAVSQQIQARATNYEDVGRYLVGLAPGTMFL